MLDYWLLGEVESRLGTLRAQAERDHLARRVMGPRRAFRPVMASALRRLADRLEGQPGPLSGRRADLVMGEG